MAQKELKPRIVQIDILRTIAIGMMITHHTVFDMWFLNKSTTNPFKGFWLLWQKSTLILFLLVVGITFAMYSKRLNEQALWQKQLQRCKQIGLVALLVSIVTFIVIPGAPVYFGVLHCIAVSMVFLPLAKSVKQSIIAVIMCIIVYIIFNNLPLPATNILAPFGLINKSFTSLDYVPLIPWLAVMYIGNIIGNLLLPLLTPVPQNQVISAITWPGKHALLLYIIHQPIIFVVLHILL